MRRYRRCPCCKSWGHWIKAEPWWPAQQGRRCGHLCRGGSTRPSQATGRVLPGRAVGLLRTEVTEAGPLTPHLSHPLSPSLVRPSRVVSAPRRGPRCLGVKTIFSSGPKANFFLRLPDSETPNGIPPLFLSLLAPALQNCFLPNKVVPGTQNLVIRHFSSFVPRLFQVSPCHLPLQSHLFHCL